MDWECDVVEGDRIDPSALQWMQTQPFGGMATQQMMQLQADIKQDSGQNQFSRGETVGGVTAASAISALQEAGGKITRLRTNVFNQGFKEIATQTMWLISQFYDARRVLFITGRMVDANPERLFGKALPGAVPPPPYTVQVQVQRRNPLRQQAQNDLFLQAYQLSAEAGQYFPLSALFEILHVDGKERILPLLKENELLPVQLQQRTEENEDLRRMCREASWMMDRQQASVHNQQAVVEQLLQERAEMEELIRQMKMELEGREKVEEAVKAADA